MLRAMQPWYATSYRRNLVDMHIDDWDERFLSKLEPARYVELLKTARVQTAMLYANSHVGLCYWPTKSGRMHRGIGGRDVLGELIDRCHAAGMSVVVYYSLIFNNAAYDEHEDWRTRDVDGRAAGDMPGRAARYRTCCPNSAPYRAFVEMQVAELCERYDFEGMFFDMTFWPAVCYCANCRSRFEQEAGGAPPETIDWQDERWRAFQRKREEWIVEFARFATELVKSRKPDVSVEHNSAATTSPWRLATSLALVDANDYIGGDLYGGLGEQSFICKLYEGLTPNQPFEFMTSRTHPTLREHTTTKTRDLLAAHTFMALAHGGAFLFIDAIDPEGTTHAGIYETMGEIFAQSARYEAFLGGERLRDVAIYFSCDSKYDPAENGRRATPGVSAVPHLRAATGAATGLRNAHIPHGVITRRDLARDLGALDRYQVIVLTSVLTISDEEVAALRVFVERGGGIYVSGEPASPQLETLCGIATEGSIAAQAYMAPADDGASLFPGVSGGQPLSMRHGHVKARAAAAVDVEVLARLLLPYTDPGDGSRLASIHSDPPGDTTEYVSATRRRLGAGQVIWVAAPIETVDHEPHRGVFGAIVRSLCSRPFAYEVDAPPAVEVSVFKQDEERRHVIALVNAQHDLPPIPIRDIRVRVFTDGKTPRRASLLPEGSRLPLHERDGYAEIAVPELALFHMVALEYA
jgi:alpha-L-fucosidase